MHKIVTTLSVFFASFKTHIKHIFFFTGDFIFKNNYNSFRKKESFFEYYEVMVSVGA